MRLVFVFALAVILAGCFTAGKRGGDSALAIYDLGFVSELSSAKPRPQQLLAVEVRAPLWFDSMGIEYRLAYADIARLREYSRARWAGPPAQLIQQRLVQQLGFVAPGQSRAGCVLRIDITEFSQVFESPDHSHALLQARLQWLDRTRSSIAVRELSLRSDSPSSDARGAVTALSDSIEQLTVTIRQWESELDLAGQLKVCGV